MYMHACDIDMHVHACKRYVHAICIACVHVRVDAILLHAKS